MIELDNISCRYGDDNRPVIENLSCTINPGEAVAVMGANGSGKSTLARLIAGLIEPNRGTVRVKAKRNSHLPVGILFQNPDNQMVAVTVEKEIAFVLENMAVAPSEMAERVERTLERFGIAHLRKRLTSELSGGEKQRVALAALMIAEPSILVLDEPDSFLDTVGRRALQAEEDRIRGEDPEVIVVRITQYRSVAERYSRLLVMNKGKVAADGDSRQILSDSEFCLAAGLSYRSRSSFADQERSVTAKAIPKVELNEVSFAYPGNEPAMADLSFSVTGGEVLGVVGPTGAGKTTLGNIICGILKPTAGTVTKQSQNGSMPLIGGAFQQPERQFFLSSCEKEIAFGPANLGRQITPNQIRELMVAVGLDPASFLKRDPFTLSMGEKRRLAFATILALDPDFVLFDEPGCGLDPEGIGRFCDLVRKLKGEGRGIIIISHDRQIIKTLSDKVLSLGENDYSLMPAAEFFADPQRSLILTEI
jgi:energy-coupling factor transport system ATP-binding protein